MSDQLKKLSKDLRKKSTDTERVLWRRLRSRQIGDLKFRRQEPMGRYIVDFVCYEARLIIEVDGGQHNRCQADADRDEWLERQGFRVLRFWDNDVLKDIEAVLEVIRRSTLPQPLPSKGGEVKKDSPVRVSSEGEGVNSVKLGLPVLPSLYLPLPLTGGDRGEGGCSPSSPPTPALPVGVFGSRVPIVKEVS